MVAVVAGASGTVAVGASGSAGVSAQAANRRQQILPTNVVRRAASARPVVHHAVSLLARGEVFKRPTQTVDSADVGIRRHPNLILAALTVVVALPYAVLGVGFVLDDWFALGNAHFDGALGAAGRESFLNRPGQGVVYALTFGLIGEHPLVHYVLQVALSALAAVLLYKLILRFLAQGPALAIAALWVVVPNHGSLTRWASASMILVGLVLLLAACLLATMERPDWWGDLAAAVLMAASVLCYEATAPAAAVAALVLPRLAQGRWRWRATLLGWAGIGGAIGWVLLHFHPSKESVRVTADLSQLFPAHFGWGIAPRPVLSVVVGLLGLAGVVAVIIRARARPQVDWLFVSGVALIVLGTLPFVRYFYAPLGAGDRVNVVAGIGTALCWYALARLCWEWRRPLAAAAGAVVLVSMAAAGLEGDRAWHRAARDAERILAALPAETPAGTIVVGPRPVQIRNVAAFLDLSNIQPAVQLRLDDRAARARMSWSEQDFDSVPPELRIDVRAL